MDHYLTLTMLGRCWHGTKSWQETAEVLAAYTGVPERGQHVRVIVTFGVQLLIERRPFICPRIGINSPRDGIINGQIFVRTRTQDFGLLIHLRTRDDVWDFVNIVIR